MLVFIHTILSDFKTSVFLLCPTSISTASPDQKEIGNGRLHDPEGRAYSHPFMTEGSIPVNVNTGFEISG